MCNYTIEPKEVSVDNVKENGFTFASNKLKTIKDNGMYFTLEKPFISLDVETIAKNKLSHKIKYVEIGSIENNTGTINPELNYNKNNVSQSNLNKPKIDDILISTVRTYLGGIGIVRENDLYSSKALLTISDCKYDKYYLFGILKTNYFIQQSLLIENNGSYPRMDKSLLSKIKIPLPPTTDIENIVSFIAQNIMDKEKQIKNKNILIDKLIEDELNIGKSNSNISADKSMFIKNGFRFSAKDTNNKVVSIFNKIKDEKGLLDICNIFTGNTILSNQYLEKENKNTYKLIQTKNIHIDMTYKSYSNIFSNTKLKKLPNKCMSITRVGNPGLICYLENEKGYISDNQYCLSLKDKFKNIFIFEYIAAFVAYLYKKEYIKDISNKTNGGFITHTIMNNMIKIPEYKLEKQMTISKIVSNEVLKKENTLDTYLENEKLRNKELGIWQLNQEIFTLKEQLEEIIECIVFNKDVDLNNYL